MPAINKFGFSFITNTMWNPVTDVFGALPANLRYINNLFNRPLNRSTHQFRRRDIPGGTGAELAERPGFFYH